MKRSVGSMGAIALFLSLYVGAAWSQQYVYPAKRQSPDQQANDEGQCHQWAVGQSGFDPGRVSAPAATPPTTASGSTRGAGVRGAARGAIVGEIVADDAGAGAAAGAVAARGASRRQKAAQSQQQNVAAQQQQADYAKARAACLEGRGYSVK